jgi:hypothetical protein
MCEGDCDKDSDCEGDDMICLSRNGNEAANEVPGCGNPNGVKDNVDICAKRTLVEAARERQQQGQ